VTPLDLGFVLDRRGRTVRVAAGTIGRLAIGTLVVLFVFQVIIRLLYRVIPTRLLSRLALALDAPIRQQFLNPSVVARRIGLRPGMRVLHLGPGNGPLTEALTQTVGASGRVEAVALDGDSLQRARAYLASAGVENASIIPGNGHRLPFEDQSFDAACLVSSIGRVPDVRALLADVWRVLRPAARLSISEVISDPAYALRKTAEARVEQGGFERLEYFGDTIAYTINFRKPMAVQPS
jgi:SAM-dependent methyltransferase